MKNIKHIYSILLTGLLTFGCHGVLDIEPLDKITAQDLFADPAGTELYMADLYYRLPIEDLNYYPKQGFEVNYGSPNNAGEAQAMFTPWASHSGRNLSLNGDALKWWRDIRGGGMNFTPWALIRNVNAFIEVIPDLDVDDPTKQRYMGEASYIRAFAYFGLAKRYGGVPIITEAQDFEGDPDALLVERSTEKETWDFILSECDLAIANLEGIEDPNFRKATKWTALALKSRAALFAASIAKFGAQADLAGPAVTEGLVGISAGEADGYYQQCLEASKELMDGPFSLYGAIPASAEEAAENFQAMFVNPNLAIGTEAILIKGKAAPGDDLGNNYDIWFNPNQTRNGWPHPGRMCPTLDLVDQFESYDRPGQFSPIVTTADGDINNYLGYDPNRTYLKYDHPLEIFEGKDARLFASVMLPGSTFKSTEIVYQNGYIQPDGEFKTDTKLSMEINGVTYHTFGGATQADYSGFDPTGSNHTSTGFGLRKFLQPDPVVPAWNQSFSDFMEFRLAEILLNYAEAQVESGQGDANIAAGALNALRRRAGHTSDIPLTVENVKRERLVELAFENKALWDLIRRREFHLMMDQSLKYALVPVLDLREDPPKYIFVRMKTRQSSPLTFEHREYYRAIDNLGLNQLTQNPGW
ncbi:RagB/SusD family nutrient uptake outer membrane protein [Marinoscillum sp.]|uniref:RagB/SusD family nutrient uptake outer membrane protein n=1 Tax=Marinoscillum sp. TaxID=2024838 RepID=UPI003BA895F6